MLTYEELTDICAQKQITITEVSNRVQMSLNGLRKAMRNNALTADKLILVCQVLDITPNQFFGIPEKDGNVQVQNGGVKNVQRMDVGTAILQEQLRIKDEQINKLLNIISK